MADSNKVRRAQRAIYKSKIKKLQDAGLLGHVDLRQKANPKAIRAFERYRSFLAGKDTAVKATDRKTARALRKKFGLKGSGKTIVIPKEKGERYSITAKGEITSVRPNPAEPGTKIKKTLGQKYKVRTGNERAYYTLPERKRGLGRIQRRTFANFDELLYYLNAYDINFDDVEEYIEIEEVTRNSKRAKNLDKKIHSERTAAIARKKRRGKKRVAKKKRKPIIGRKK